MFLRRFELAVRYGLLCLRHPHVLPEFWRTLRSGLKRLFFPSLRTRQAAGKAEATRWCQDNAINTERAVSSLTGESQSIPFEHQFKDHLDRSWKIVEGCPVRMGGAGDLGLIWQLAEHVEARRAIETGVAYGWSSLAILLSLRKRQNSVLVSTDMPYPCKNSDRYVGCAVPPELKQIWRVIRRPDREALPIALSILPEIDICHYDSDKSYEGRMWAYPRLWRALRPGGVLISDDISDNLAFRDLCRLVDQEAMIVTAPSEHGVKYVGVLRKPGGAVENTGGEGARSEP